MRITQALCRQHLGRMIKKNWWASSKRKIIPTPAEDILVSKGFQVVDAKEVVKPPKRHAPYVTVSYIFERPPLQNETHPDWNERPRLTYGDNSLLLDGTAQAQVLLKTERIAGLPEKLENLKEESSEEIQNLVARYVYSSHIFDAHQEKLPKKKDPMRPAWNFPRTYGIPDVRKTHNLTQKLLQLCELISDPMICQQRKILNHGQVRTYIERDNDLLYFEMKFDTMITSNKLLTPMSVKNDGFDNPLPNIEPLDPIISLRPEQIYKIDDHYPVASQSQWTSPHTIFSSFDSQLVKNVTELPVTEDQMLARSMLKSFATAACHAKLKFGDTVIDLPEPVTVQCVQSNGKWFDFSVFQLNTLDIASDKGTRNIWWCEPRMELFDTAEYVSGRPTLEGYNPRVFENILAFYRNF